MATSKPTNKPSRTGTASRATTAPHKQTTTKADADSGKPAPAPVEAAPAERSARGQTSASVKADPAVAESLAHAMENIGNLPPSTPAPPA